ncbi:MAG: DUF3015 domain-containing protein [Pseudomonadales bacterium]|nr:DUF3015 domain-containing protein [Pseudomonadales bacterium]
MKKTLIAAALILSPGIAMANPGCGLGATVFEGQSGLGPHVLAATTNGTSGNITFGMTFGSLGCNVDQSVELAAEFLNENMDQIAENMASGSGEALEAYAQLLGVDTQDYNTFAATVQDQFSSIFSHQEVGTLDVLNSTLAVMKQDSALSQYVI